MGSRTESQSSLTATQISQFLDYIRLPRPWHSTDPSPELLTQVHVHTIARIPYENLTLHYNASHVNTLDLQDLFRKTVTDARGRGGYCMEVALLYHHVLKGLGFNVYTAPAKNRDRVDGVPHGDWRSWVHITNIVTFAASATSPEQRFSSDVAFGGDGPTIPLPLISGLEHHNLGPQDMRLSREWLPEQTWRPAGEEGERHKYWVYQYRNGPEKPWNSFYCFLEMEFTTTDWIRVNGFTSALGFTHMEHVIVVKFLGREREATQSMEIYGKRMLFDDVVKENLGGKTKVIHVCQSEEDRVQALRSQFDIELSTEEQKGIMDWRTKLPH